MPYNEEILAHHGIKGQKWGLRRFQNKDGTLTKLGRKRLGLDKTNIQYRKEAREKKIQEKKDQKEASAKEKLRREAIRDPRKLYKYKDVFTRDEITKIMEDIDFDRKVKAIHDTDVTALVNRLKRTADLTKNVSDIFKNSANIYNSAADAYNMFADMKKVKNPDAKVKKLGKIGSDNDKIIKELLENVKKENNDD
jgi:hypothetical protein